MTTGIGLYARAASTAEHYSERSLFVKNFFSFWAAFLPSSFFAWPEVLGSILDHAQPPSSRPFCQAQLREGPSGASPSNYCTDPLIVNAPVDTLFIHKTPRSRLGETVATTLHRGRESRKPRRNLGETAKGSYTISMRITVGLPKDIAQSPDPAREALEALAIQGYRCGALTSFQTRCLLGFETRDELDGFLKGHNVWEHAYSIQDLRRDCDTLEELQD